MRPRYQSTLGSTYTQRVAAARPQRHPSCKYNHHYHGELLQPLTHSTELGLSRSLNDNNKAVDKLPVSLFYPPSISAASTTAGMAFMKAKPSANRLSTRRSMMRHETAVALRSHNLASRMNELRSLPHVLERMEVLQLWKKQQHIAEHGVNIIARNRATSTFQVLQKPSQTPLLPSATDHKLHQAKKRKQELEAARDQNVQRIVVRWQTRYEQRAERARRVHIQSQWLLVVALSESSKKWLTRFYELHQKRCELLRILMIKRLQRYWRRRTLEQRNSLQLLRSGRGIPLSSAFFRMPVVIRAVTKLQRNIRVWLERKHHSEGKENVALIVTAWFEFQDVKFRRIILRFRKRVRDFQVMWRSWRAITAARIKLMLLVWAKVERKAKRRHGISPINPQQHKQLQDMHRHFRNRGAVHMPIGADLQLRSNMEEEFQLVMYDVYTTRQNLIPQAPKPPIRSPLGAKVSLKKCRKFSPLIQSSPLHLPSTNSNNRSVPPVSRKIPHQLKVTVLRKLLSEKRKMYSDARDREREAWAAARKKMRSEAFRYDVLDELAAFQHLLAKYTTFLMLHSITETEMVRLIHQTQIEVSTADSSAVIAPT
ncbi:uncharacterized protein PITG_16395 [Phytophthora infestans T30-4]|uniref:Uncharacterized protein n=1 Tax=Phytophthora infestans (strain T30-4) TaxID=403677 RepID=D0NTJ7_PHYIT|nr:uncharacterized protein PITG_16395 [Phytophthora infestans T30-4]EEY64959.1 conserved hypothetical protein [Phytophthora infestans T30-4]|eukprot:XP_002897447.1 conserved hypothetical protein [Phytophthora infestans T30-4]